MELVTEITKRIAEGVWDTLAYISSHAIHVLTVLLICFVVSFLPTWLIGLATVVVGALIGYVTYRDTITELEKDEE